MGNIGSQIGNSSNKYKLERSSSSPDATQLSLPRVNQQQQQQQKVLPVTKEPPPKLKPTENGRILHAGGTLSGRHQEKISRGNFMNAKEKVKFLRDIQEDKSQRRTPHQQQKELIKKYGSEPDLRYHLRAEKSNAKPKRYAGTKRSTQATNSLEKRAQELENFCEKSESFSAKRTGLFRTRAESKKQQFPFKLMNNKSPQSEKTTESYQYPVPQKELKENLAIPQTHDEFTDDMTNLESQKAALKQPDRKKYYFGMENSIENLDYLNYEIEDYDVTKLSDEIRSSLSNNFLDEEDNQSISLYLRPILPKKQLEMPKFSSSVAWKLLYSAEVDSNLDGSTNNNEDDPVFSEDKIEKLLPVSPQRVLPNKSLDFQFSQDKSGDSGISGDETPKPTLSHYKSKQSWTPQQDLGDESSTDDEMRFNSMPYSTSASKPHIFSLSLPRDHMEWHKTQAHLQSGDSTNQLNKRCSVSGAFGNHIATYNEATTDAHCTANNFNWLLSKSAPNSLNNGFNSLESAYVYNEALTSLVPLNGHQNTKRRIMYLPDSDGMCLDKRRAAKNDPVCRSALLHDNPENVERDDFLREAEKREQERLKEIETMQRIEEEFRRKRARYNNLYSNTRQNFRKVLLSAGEKSV